MLWYSSSWHAKTSQFNTLTWELWGWCFADNISNSNSNSKIFYSALAWHWITKWWCHQMETFSASLTLCEGNQLVTGGFYHHWMLVLFEMFEISKAFVALWELDVTDHYVRTLKKNFPSWMGGRGVVGGSSSLVPNSWQAINNTHADFTVLSNLSYFVTCILCYSH